MSSHETSTLDRLYSMGVISPSHYRAFIQWREDGSRPKRRSQQRAPGERNRGVRQRRRSSEDSPNLIREAQRSRHRRIKKLIERLDIVAASVAYRVAVLDIPVERLDLDRAAEQLRVAGSVIENYYSHGEVVFPT